jgi:hypothetical protein
MIEELISRVFYTRNVAHWTHWRTKSFSEHMALNTFYDGIIDTLDRIVEACQGAHGLVGAIPAPSASASDIIDHLEEESAWIAEHRSEIAYNVTAIENIIDELSGIYLSTIYKLKNLK